MLLFPLVYGCDGDTIKDAPTDQRTVVYAHIAAIVTGVERKKFPYIPEISLPMGLIDHAA